MTNMIDCGPDAAAVLGQLTTPVRNRYYYGKLLDADHFQLEQDYENRKRWLLNRLALGTGVLCGLDVTVIQSPNGPQLVVGPGVAIDGVGRELIVPAPSSAINPLQLTDECGQPLGPPLPLPAPGLPLVLTVCICYHECEAEPAPVMVSQCGPDRACECGLVRERYSLQIRRPLRNPPLNCGSLFSSLPTATDPDRRQRLCEQLRQRCTPLSDAGTCVALAEIAIDDKGNATVSQCAARTTLYSNAVLLDLILCLAERVDQCCGGTAKLPVVTSIWPPSAAALSPNATPPGKQSFGYWTKSPHLQITFNEAMSSAELQAPNPWLGLFAFQVADGKANVRRWLLEYTTQTPPPPPPATGVTVNYRLQPAFPPIDAYYLVLINATGGTIQDTQTPRNTLAADYAGTQLSAADIARCWALSPGQQLSLDLTYGLINTGAALPSGSDNVAGGIFHSWFQVTSKP